jgi:hypothetical protein
MSRLLLIPFAVAALVAQQPASTSLLQVKRIYVNRLTGNGTAEALRELIISGIDSTKLFVLTDNPDRADAVLKGAADDNTFTDMYDTNSSVSTHEGGGRYSSAKSVLGLGSGTAANAGGAESDSHHLRERKHEAYASVRLCNRDGDVIWSTTQESTGGKFRGASSDVAAKVARQLQLDVERAHTPDTKPLK